MYSTSETGDVTPSMVLDHFIEERESPTTIMRFLNDMEDSERLRTLQDSDCVARLFQLDFITRCNFTEQRYFMVLSRRYGTYQSTYLSWQVLKSNLDDSTKHMFRGNLDLSVPYRHPYAGITGRLASEFDTLFLDKERNLIEIVDILNSMQSDRFSSFCICLCRSLFFERILQLDIFSMLTDDRKWILVGKICSSLSRFEPISGSRDSNTWCNLIDCMCRFNKQVFCSTLDTDLKCDLYETTYRICNYLELERIPDSVKLEIDEASSYAELELNLVLNGIDEIGVPVVLYMLRQHRIDHLTGFVKHHGDFLAKYFDICDMVRALSREDGAQ